MPRIKSYSVSAKDRRIEGDIHLETKGGMFYFVAKDNEWNEFIKADIAHIGWFGKTRIHAVCAKELEVLESFIKTVARLFTESRTLKRKVIIVLLEEASQMHEFNNYGKTEIQSLQFAFTVCEEVTIGTKVNYYQMGFNENGEDTGNRSSPLRMYHHDLMTIIDWTQEAEDFLFLISKNFEMLDAKLKNFLKDEESILLAVANNQKLLS